MSHDVPEVNKIRPSMDITALTLGKGSSGGRPLIRSFGINENRLARLRSFPIKVINDIADR